MGSSKKVTIGHKYFFGIHMGLCRGPIDALLQIKVGDRDAWRGAVTDSRTIYINKPNLFGGEKKEGGIQGPLAVMMGASDQPVNSRLAAMLGGIVPAFRGVSTLFFDGLISAMNPYPRPWMFRMRRILKGWDGEVWYPEKATISLIPAAPLALYFSLDISGSMASTTPNGQTRLANMQAAVTAALQVVSNVVLAAGVEVDIMVVGWGTDPDARVTMMRRRCTSGDVTALQAFVSDLTASMLTYFPAGLLDMPGFFTGAPAGSKHVAFFLTDGVPSGYLGGGVVAATEIAQAAGALVAAQAGVSVYAMNMDLADTTYTAYVDNTPDDGVPVLAGGDPDSITNVILGALGSVSAMNPAHIIYEAYTNRDWGRGLDAERLDLDSFTACADVLYSEGFGMCIKWTRQDKLSAFVGSILDHIGGAVYVSRRTGRIVLRLIRDGYDIDDLPLFTPETGLLGIDDDDSSADDKAINCVVVKYRDPRSNEVLQVRARNLAAITAHGLNQQTTEYIGLPDGALAARVAERDLNVYSSSVKRIKVRLDRRGRVVEPTGVFRISDPLRGIENLVLRAGRIEDGLLTQGEITVLAVQDVFGLPETSYVEPSLPIWTPPSTAALPIEHQRLTELSYRELVRITAPADMAFVDSGSSYLMPLAVKPSTLSQGYGITTRIGSGEFIDRGPGDFIASATLAEALELTEQVVVIEGGVDLDDVVLGTPVLIDNEIVRIDSYDAATGELTVGRGCVDTVRAKHVAGTRIWFFEDAAGSDPTEYMVGSVLQTKLLTRTSSAELEPASAPVLSMTIEGRHARPYPPGRFRINGVAWPELVSGDVTVGWAHRDRLLQQDQLVDDEITNIGPELGVEYRVRIFDNGNSLRFSADVDSGPVTATADLFAGATALRVELFSLRDSLESLQRLAHTVDYEGGGVSGAPTLLSVTTTVIATNVTAHAVQMPATVAAGDLLIISIALDGNPAVATPAGWTAHSAIPVGTDRARHAQFLKVAAGIEGGTTVSISSSVAEQSVAYVHRIEAGTFANVRPGALYDSRFSGAQNGSSALTSLFPARGFVPHLVIAWNFVERNDSTGGPTVSTWPLLQEQRAHNTGAADGVFHAVCSAPILSEKIDVASYQLSSPPAATWGAKMLAIPPSGAAVQPLLLFRREFQSGNNNFTSLTAGINSDTVNAPVLAGDLLLLCISLAKAATVLGTPSGWTLLNRTSRQAWFYKIAGASEPASQTLSSSVGTQYWSTVYVIAGGTFDSAVAPQIAVASGTGTEPAPPVLATDWSSGRHMVLAVESHAMTASANAITQYPLDSHPITHLRGAFSTSQTVNGVGGGFHSGIIVGSDVVPGSYTLSLSAEWTAATVMIKSLP